LERPGLKARQLSALDFSSVEGCCSLRIRKYPSSAAWNLQGSFAWFLIALTG